MNVCVDAGISDKPDLGIIEANSSECNSGRNIGIPGILEGGGTRAPLKMCCGADLKTIEVKPTFCGRPFPALRLSGLRHCAELPARAIAARHDLHSRA